MKMSSILIGSENPKALAEFYGKVFDAKPGFEDGGYIGYDTHGTFFMIGPHDKVKGKATNPERMLIGFDAEDVKAEFERIKKTGATVIAEPYDAGDKMQIATFADPDGNYFQIATPWKG
ncbi:VOC family protein [Candidatus Microgenomates bacterium]|nr:VOC family protein [Candidatus Microgenomates bacterium]